ncbi:hypothetical protein [Methylobacterium trifolii]|uniref:Nif11 domain-containing protein n=1 Tax=Methylobacterium trifolii TaxID=1003092 RepID=A0ABQ4TTR6_9HYPH|nr:hypothetical protein [Methylobacterium trifolii]GJE58299.1 hypothetical protein MPOCJGCO_0378 [Methylobacterium trifolii]
MTAPAEAGGGFPAFARRVAEDADLAARLRPIPDRQALAAAAVAEGAALGLRFTAEAVEAAMAENRHGWLMHPAPMPPPGAAS